MNSLADTAPTRIEVTEILDAQQINVIRIVNPFDPRDHVRETVEWAPGKTLAACFPVGVAEQVVSLNGKIIPAEHFALTHLSRGDNLVVCPVPQGGGGGDKSILSMIAMIAVSMVAPLAATALTGLTSGIGFQIAVAGITMAGALLVQTIFAPSTPTSDNKSDSATYGIDGAKLTSLEGLPVPVNYGRFRVAGNIIALHVENVDDNQVLYMLINAGEGAIASIDGILVNDNPIEDYKGIEFQTRLGYAAQPIIPWFNDTITPVNKNVKMTTDWSTHTTLNPVDRVRVDFVAPSGLFWIDKETGSTQEQSVTLDIELRKQGTTTWEKMKLDNVVVGYRDVHIELEATPIGYTDDQGQFWKINPDGTSSRYMPAHKWVYSDTGEEVSAADLEYISNTYNKYDPDYTGAGDGGAAGDDGTGPAGDGNGSVGGGTAA